MSDLSQAELPRTSISLKSKVSPEEWAMRVDVAACYRLVALFGMNDLVYNHISGRVPGEDGHFLINPYGYAYEEVTASSLVKIDFDGKPVRDLGKGAAMILRNHGLLTAGRTVCDAFVTMHWLERACQAQLAAMARNAADARS